MQHYRSSMSSESCPSPTKTKKNFQDDPYPYHDYANAQTQIATILPNFDQNPRFYRLWYFTQGFIGCFGGLLIHLVIGSIYQWGLMNPFVSSYYKMHGYGDLIPKTTIIACPIMVFCIGCTMTTGLISSEKFGYIPVLLFCCTISSLLIFVSSFISNLYLFLLIYTIGFGLMMGNTFMIPMRICNDYFPNKQPYVNGFILIGTGVGSVVFGMFFLNYVNPEHIQPIKGMYIGELGYLSERLPASLRWLSLFYLLVGYLGTLLLLPLVRFLKRMQILEQVVISKTFIEQVIEKYGKCPSYRAAFLSPLFSLQILIIVCASCGNLFINTNYKMYAYDVLEDDNFLTYVGIAGAISNGLSRFFWGQLFNRIGYKLTMLAIFILNVLCLATIRFAVYQHAFYMIQVFIFNATLGGLLVVAPTYSTIVFGKKIGPRIFGIFWCSFAIGNFIQYIYIVTLQDEIGLDNIIYICLGMNFLYLLIVLAYKFEAKWKNDPKYFKLALLPKQHIQEDQRQLLIYSVLGNRVKNPKSSNIIPY